MQLGSHLQSRFRLQIAAFLSDKSDSCQMIGMQEPSKICPQHNLCTYLGLQLQMCWNIFPSSILSMLMLMTHQVPWSTSPPYSPNMMLLMRPQAM